MKIQYDKKVDALYIRFQVAKEKVQHTLRIDDYFFVDVGKKGKVYGIEILDASTHLPTKNIVTRVMRIPKNVKRKSK